MRVESEVGVEIRAADSIAADADALHRTLVLVRALRAESDAGIVTIRDAHKEFTQEIHTHSTHSHTQVSHAHCAHSSFHWSLGIPRRARPYLLGEEDARVVDLLELQRDRPAVLQK